MRSMAIVALGARRDAAPTSDTGSAMAAGALPSSGRTRTGGGLQEPHPILLPRRTATSTMKLIDKTMASSTNAAA